MHRSVPWQLAPALRWIQPGRGGRRLHTLRYDGSLAGNRTGKEEQIGVDGLMKKYITGILPQTGKTITSRDQHPRVLTPGVAGDPAREPKPLEKWGGALRMGEAPLNPGNIVSAGSPRKLGMLLVAWSSEQRCF